MPEEKKIKLPNVDVRSDEVQEILGFIPHWIIRTGIVLLAAIIVIILIGSWFFKYPDIINAKVIVSTEFPPSPVVARISGKIEHLFVEDNQKIKKNDSILVIESGSVFSDVEELGNLLPKLAVFIADYDSSYFDSISFRTDISLGSLQSFYANLVNPYTDYLHFMRNNVFDNKIESRKTEIFDHQLLYKRQFRQRDIKEDLCNLSKIQLDRIAALREGGAKTDLDYETEKAKHLQKQHEFESSRTNLSNTKITITRLKQELDDLKYTYSEEKMNLELSLVKAYDVLVGELISWNLKYMLRSPAKGIISFTDFWSENMEVAEGMTVMRIVPEETSSIIGKAQLTIKGAGKVKTGQEVNIKLDNFPYMEFGMVRARVKTISLVPENELYNLELEFPDGLRTNYNRKLEFSQSLQGTAEIITDDIRLLIRILNPLKALFKKHLDN